MSNQYLPKPSHHGVRVYVLAMRRVIRADLAGGGRTITIRTPLLWRVQHPSYEHCGAKEDNVFAGLAETTGVDWFKFDALS
jgi:hypothetical protein